MFHFFLWTLGSYICLGQRPFYFLLRIFQTISSPRLLLHAFRLQQVLLNCQQTWKACLTLVPLVRFFFEMQDWPLVISAMVIGIERSFVWFRQTTFANLFELKTDLGSFKVNGVYAALLTFYVDLTEIILVLVITKFWLLQHVHRFASRSYCLRPNMTAFGPQAFLVVIVQVIENFDFDRSPSKTSISKMFLHPVWTYHQLRSR